MKYLFWKELWRRFQKANCLQLASQISFFSLLSLIPLIMLGVFFTATLLGSSGTIYEQMIAKMIDVLPVGQQEIMRNLDNVVAGRLSLGAWGIGILIFTASLLFSSLEQALDTIFATEKRRNFFHSRLLGLGFILLVALFFSLPTMAELTQNTLARFGFQFPLSSLLTGKYFFLVMAYFAFVLGIIVIPNEKVSFRYALAGGIIFAVGISLAKRFFRWYLSGVFDQYNVIYGSLTALVLLIVWIYYVASIFLVSSLVVAQLQTRQKGGSHGGT